MLSAMFSENFNMQPDEDGEYFIDINPKFFDLILDYLRKSTIIPKKIQKMDLLEKEELLIEVEFYQIQGLIKLIKPSFEKLTFIPEFSQILLFQMIIRK